MWHLGCNLSFMKLQECFLCSKKTKIMILFNNFFSSVSVSLYYFVVYIVFLMCCIRAGGVAKVHICSRATSGGWKIATFVFCFFLEMHSSHRSYFQTKQTSVCKHHKFMWSNWGCCGIWERKSISLILNFWLCRFLLKWLYFIQTMVNVTAFHSKF